MRLDDVKEPKIKEETDAIVALTTGMDKGQVRAGN
jgi:hypothetical protein